MLGYRARNSKMTLACGVDHVIETDCPFLVTTECADDLAKVVFTVEALEGEPITITKYLTYHTSRGRPRRRVVRPGRVDTLDRAVRQGFDELVKGQRAYLDDFWHRSDVQVEADPDVIEPSCGRTAAGHSVEPVADSPGGRQSRRRGRAGQGAHRPGI